MSFYKKIRFSLRFISAIFKKQLKNIIIGLFIGVFFYFLFPYLFKLIPKQRQQIKIGKVGQYTVNEIPPEVLENLSFGLTQISEKGEILPLLSESWQIEEEGKIYKFKLREQDIFWHDGYKLVPSDINYNFNDVVFSLEGNELIFKLKEPFSPFLSVVSKPVFKKGLIGLGKYKVRKITKKGNYIKSISLVPSDKTDKTLPNKTYKFYNSEKDLKTAFNLGEINRIENLFDLDGLFLGKNTKHDQELKKDIYLALFLNNSKPFLEVKSFRQALAYAIPKEKGETRAIGSINPLSWAYNPDIKPYEQDLARAAGLLEKDKETLSSFKITLTTFPQYEKTAQLIKQSWKKLGIGSEIKITTYLPTDFEALLIAREVPLEPDQYYFWHTTQAGNITNLKNPRIDKLLEDGRKTMDIQARKDIYYDFQRFLAEESPAIFLTHPVVYNVYR